MEECTPLLFSLNRMSVLRMKGEREERAIKSLGTCPLLISESSVKVFLSRQQRVLSNKNISEASEMVSLLQAILDTTELSTE